MAKVIISTIADAVEGLPGRKLYVHGGGLSGIMVPSLPFLYGRLSLAIAIELEVGDQTVPISATFYDPMGNQLAEAGAEINRQEPAQELEEVWIGLSFPPIPIPVGGAYKMVTKTNHNEHVRILNITSEINGVNLRPVPGSHQTH